MRYFSIFPKIDTMLAENRMSYGELGAKSNIKYASMRNKLNGKTEFTRSEMFAIQGTFSRKVPLDILFAIPDESA